jgi:hypothetical protein
MKHLRSFIARYIYTYSLIAIDDAGGVGCTANGCDQVLNMINVRK